MPEPDVAQTLLSALIEITAQVVVLDLRLVVRDESVEVIGWGKHSVPRRQEGVMRSPLCRATRHGPR
jgi:hypothetical protein